jgi:enoyl-CoA hydratase
MLAAGARLAERLLSFPQPTVIACNGNSIAMGAFTLLSADHRIGAAGDFRIGLNEVAIGMTIPWFGLAIARHRLQRPYYDRCSVTGVLLDPQEAQTAGFLDAVVDAQDLADTAAHAAGVLTGVDRAAHLATKLRVREHVLAGIREGIERVNNAAATGEAP